MNKYTCAILFALAACSAARGAEFQIVALADAQQDLQPNTIAFTDQNAGPPGPFGPQLIAFDDWARTSPLQKQFLNLFPGYDEPTSAGRGSRATKSVRQKLDMYVAQARFEIPKPPQAIDPAQDATIAFLQRLDPAIMQQPLARGEVNAAASNDPQHPWCAAAPDVVCVQSSYRLEGQLPAAIRLANQLTDAKKVSDHLEFQSELRSLAPADLDQGALMQLTGIDAPITGAIEQSIFHVNQIMQFGKLLVVLQRDGKDPDRTLASVFIAIAVKASVLENRARYAGVPVLRNMVPEEVLLGKSSFNTGSSLSAGLPNYARNEIKTLARVLAE